jgi:hypothetical protein
MAAYRSLMRTVPVTAVHRSGHRGYENSPDPLAFADREFCCCRSVQLKLIPSISGMATTIRSNASMPRPEHIWAHLSRLAAAAYSDREA